MGYFKNELISQQVEVGDRVPAPKPATEHVALQHDENNDLLAGVKGSWSVVGWLLIGTALFAGVAIIVGVL